MFSIDKSGFSDYIIIIFQEGLMFKNQVLLIAIIGCTIFLFSAVSPQKSISSSLPDTVIIDSKQYKKKTRGPLAFSHGDHTKYGVTCAECHHVYENGKNIWKEGDHVQKCGECHDGEKKKGNVPNLKTAFHDQCQTCHKNVGDEAKAPVKKCNSCHSKK